MNELDFALDTKAIDDEGHIEGVAVGFGNLDYGGDIVLPGAIKNLATKQRVPMLLFHKQDRPAGVWTNFKETSEGLEVKGRFAMKSRAGQEAHALVREGAIGGLSMGYRTLNHKIVGKSRHLTAIDLHEISLVTIPMNDRATILSVKDITMGGNLPSLSDFEDFLREAGGFSKTQATAIAGKGLSHLLRSESGSETDADRLERFARRILG